MDNKFKSEHNFEIRLNEAKGVMVKYKERLPIIVQKTKDCKLPNIDKCKYLVPRDMSMGQFVYVIRKRIKLDSSEALFICVNNQLASSSESIDSIYHKYKDEDGFMYIFYTSENTFG
jgi:GABA(A) receptor-associated protein